jgi:hypothetical protein
MELNVCRACRPFSWRHDEIVPLRNASAMRVNGPSDTPTQAVPHDCCSKSAPHRKTQADVCCPIGPEIERKNIGRTAGSAPVDELEISFSRQSEEPMSPHAISIPKRSGGASPWLDDASMSGGHRVCSCERETRARACAADPLAGMFASRHTPFDAGPTIA